MATPTEPITGALFRALRTTADPELARAAEEEIRQIYKVLTARSVPPVFRRPCGFLDSGDFHRLTSHGKLNPQAEEEIPQSPNKRFTPLRGSRPQVAY